MTARLITDGNSLRHRYKLIAHFLETNEHEPRIHLSGRIVKVVDGVEGVGDRQRLVLTSGRLREIRFKADLMTSSKY